MQQQRPAALVEQLADFARSAGAQGETRVLADRDDGLVLRVGDLVAKAHAADTERPSLPLRLAAAAHPRLNGILLPPAQRSVTTLPGGRQATVWPYGTPVDPDSPQDAPWTAAGVLLARLHAVPPPVLESRPHGSLPPMRGPAKLARAMERLRAAPRRSGDHTAREAVEGAWRRLPDWCRDPAEAAAQPHRLCHGDFHLGQLIRHHGPSGEWRLIDVDDLGVGDPAWDLARPACWYAAGLLPASWWQQLLDAYQSTAGAPGADPWPRLDAPARALTAQTAALALAKAAHAGRRLDDAEEALVGACARITRMAAVRHT